jgi:integrase
MIQQKRNRRGGVEDRWKRADGTASAAAGGNRLRWRGRYVDGAGREQVKGFARKVDAQRWIDAATTGLTSGSYVDPRAGLVTVGALHAAWSSSRARTKQTTEAKVESSWKAHVCDRWATVPVADVHTSAVRAWVATMAKDGRQAATIETALGVLRMVLETAVENRQITRNPCEKVLGPRRKHADRGYLTHSQVAALAESISVRSYVLRGGRTVDVVHDDFGTVVKFLAYTGLRWGEMAALKVGSFDMLRRRVNITEAVAEVKGHVVWDTPKGHERRSVPFPAFLAEPLATLMVGKSRDDLVFAGEKGAVLRVSTFRPRLFAPAVARCRSLDDMFPTITPHDLRHTAASLAISAGANVKAVQTMLGHKSAALTLDTYAGLFGDDLDGVSAALDRAARESAADPLRTRTRNAAPPDKGNTA